MSNKNVLRKLKLKKFADNMSDSHKAALLKSLAYNQIDKTHDFHYGENIEFYSREIFMFNHKGWIIGYNDDDYTASDYVSMNIYKRQPKGIVLGDCYKDKMEYYTKGFDAYQDIQFSDVSDVNLIGRQDFLNFFKNDYPNNLRIFKDKGEFPVFEADSINKRKEISISLSAAYHACFSSETTKIFYASPHPFLILEDLALSLPLDELQQMFVNVLNSFKEKAKNNEFYPSLNVPDFYECIRNISKELFETVFFSKRCQYTAGVFRKIHRIFNHNMLLMNNILADLTYQNITDNLCPEYDRIFRGKVYESFLDDLSKDKETFEELMEKLCILSHLVDKEFQNYLVSNSNPLPFMFNGLFKDIPKNGVSATFGKYNAIYGKELETLYITDMSRIPDLHESKRSNLREYKEEVQKLEKTNSYAYIEDKYHRENEINFLENVIWTQIALNVKRKELMGYKMIEEKLELAKYRAGQINSYNNDLYMKLFAEANTQLQLFKLPPSYQKYESVIRKALIDDSEKIQGAPYKEIIKDSLISLNNQYNSIRKVIIRQGAEDELRDRDINGNQLNILDLPNVMFVEEKLQELKAKSKNDPKTKQLEDFVEKLKVNCNLSGDSANSLLLSKGAKDSVLFTEEELNNKSEEELKQLGFDKVANLEYKVDEDGNIITKQENDEEIFKFLTSNKDLPSNEEKYVTSELSTNEEKLFNYHKKFAEIIRKKDNVRFEKIIHALETGKEFDDPLYYVMLTSDEKYRKKRLSYLKRYYNGGKDAQSKKKIEEYIVKYNDYAQKWERSDPKLMDDFVKKDSDEARTMMNLSSKVMDDYYQEYQNKFGDVDEETVDPEMEQLSLENLVNDKLEEIFNEEDYKKLIEDDDEQGKNKKLLTGGTSEVDKGYVAGSNRKQNKKKRMLI